MGQLNRAAATGSALWMPHFSAGRVLPLSTTGADPVMSTWQARPVTPLVDDKTGKPMKYATAMAQGCVIGTHPATPHSYSAADRVIVAEGLLKGDAVVTALLLEDCGHEPSDLELVGDETDADQQKATKAARQRLRDLMEAASERTLVVTLFGVGTWHKNPEWNALPVSGSRVYVALDADAGENHAVWRQASQLRQFLTGRDAVSVKLVRPMVDGLPKAGVDDALAVGKSLQSMLDAAVGELPPEPARPVAVGSLRGNDRDCVTEELVKEPDPQGLGTVTHWKTVAPIVGRVVRIESRQVTTERSIETNRRPEDGVEDDGNKSDVELEFAWHNKHGDRVDARVRGPIRKVFGERPDALARTEGVTWPRAMSMYAGGPLTQEVMRAAREHRDDETVETAGWGCMGYVPDPDHATPVWILGRDVITPHDRETSARPGVTAEMTRSAPRYGAHPLRTPSGSLDAARWLAAVRTLVETVDSGAWTDRGHAAMVLAAQMRPAVPVGSRASLMLMGPRRSGKSFTAEQVMASVAREPGDFADLDGSADDTAYYTEQAMSMTPLYVIDDLAATEDPVVAARQAQMVVGAVRAVHNHAPRKRSQLGGGSPEVHHPRCTLIVTAENTPRVESALDRTVPIEIGHGFLHPEKAATDAVERVLQTTPVAGQVLTGLAQATLEHGQEHGWTTLQDLLSEMRHQLVNALVAGDDDPEDPIPGLSKRAGEVGTELLLGLSWLAWGVSVHARGDAEGAALFNRLHELTRAFMNTYATTIHGRRSESGGRRLLSVIRQLLAAGLCHIQVPGSAHAPRDAATAQALGWQVGTDQLSERPCGPAVGFYTTSGGKPAVVITGMETLLSIAARQGMVGHGLRARQQETAIVTEGLAAERKGDAAEGWTKQPGTLAKFRIKGSVGVPIWLDVMLGEEDAR